jgi:hypothetical protein
MTPFWWQEEVVLTEEEGERLLALLARSGPVYDQIQAERAERERAEAEKRNGEIRDRAYYIWLETSRTPEECWLQAEREWEREMDVDLDCVSGGVGYASYVNEAKYFGACR